MDTMDSQTSLPGSQTRLTGCTLLVLGWLALSFLLGVAALLLQVIAPNGPLLRMSFSLMLACPCLFILVLAVLIYLGLAQGPHRWPQFYSWIENQPALNAVLPGALAGLCIALVWVIASYEISGGMAEMFLIAIVILLPGAILIGPILGAIGGLIAGKLISRFRSKTAMLWVAGILGGATTSALVLGAITSVAFSFISSQS